MKAEEVYSKLKKMIAQSAAGITGRTSTTNPDGSVTITISFTSGSPLSFTISPVKGEDGVGFKDAKIKEVINANNETEYHLILINDKDEEIDAGLLPDSITESKEFDISTPSYVWNIQHNLDCSWYKLSINIIDTDNNIVYGDIDAENSTDNLLIIKFNKPIAGKIIIKK